jgi:hypothetical protein
MSHALWLEAGVGFSVAKITLTTVDGTSTFDGETSLLFTFVWDTFCKESFAVFMITALLFYTDRILTQFLFTTMFFGCTINRHTLVSRAVFFFAAVIVSFAVNFDTCIRFLTKDEVSSIDVFIIDTFTGTDFAFITMVVISAWDWYAFEFLASAFAVLTFGSFILETQVMSDTVDLDTVVSRWWVLFGITNVTFGSITMLIFAALQDFTLMFDALTSALFASFGINFTGNGFFLTHSMTLALYWIACLICVGTDFICLTVIVVSAVNFDTGSFFANVWRFNVTDFMTVVMVSTFDWFTFVIFTDELGIKVSVKITSVISLLPTMFVFAANLIFTYVW